MANGYYDRVEELSLRLAHEASNANKTAAEGEDPDDGDTDHLTVLSGWRNYGLIGPVVLCNAARVALD